MKQQAPEWLSLICQGGSFEEVEKWLEAAAEYGFKTVQPVFFWANYTESDFDRLAKKLNQLQLSTVAFGVYSDLYKWDKPAGACFESTIEDLKLAASCAHKLDTMNLVSWCGTVGDFAAPTEANASEEVIATFKANQEKLLPTLIEHDVTFLFEPWRDHILADEKMTMDACQVSPDHYKAVIDFPNFISPEQWPQREERIAAITAALHSHAGIIHLKDMLINAEGTVELPMFGRGDLTSELAKAMEPYVGKYAIIAEHMQQPEDLPELIESVWRDGPRVPQRV